MASRVFSQEDDNFPAALSNPIKGFFRRMIILGAALNGPAW